jgi:hypothetical protein
LVPNLCCAQVEGEVTVVADESIGEEDALLAKLLAAAAGTPRLSKSTLGQGFNSPFVASTNSIRVPASRFKRSRTSKGMVTCPLLVSVAVAMDVLLTESVHPYYPPRQR